MIRVIPKNTPPTQTFDVSFDVGNDTAGLSTVGVVSRAGLDAPILVYLDGEENAYLELSNTQAYAIIGALTQALQHKGEC